MFRRGPAIAAALLQLFLLPLLTAALPADESQSGPGADAVAVADSSDPGDERIRTTVRDVLNDPEFRQLLKHRERSRDSSDRLPGWLERFFQWLLEPDEDSDALPSGPAVDVGDALMLVALVIVAGVLIYLIVLMVAWLDRQHREVLPDMAEEALRPSSPPGDLPCSEYERRALQHAERGDFRMALRELVLGTMSWIERAGLIRYRRGLTNRDYVRAVWRDADRRVPAQDIVKSFELVFYGRRPADSARFDHALLAFRSSFGQEAAHAESTR